MAKVFQDLRHFVLNRVCIDLVDSMRVFVASVETGPFSGAAARLGGDGAWPLTEGAAQHRVSASGPYLMNSARLARDLAVEGEVIALCPDYMVLADLKEGRLQHVLLQACGPQLDVHAVYIGQRRVARRTRAFLDLVAANLISGPETA